MLISFESIFWNTSQSHLLNFTSIFSIKNIFNIFRSYLYFYILVYLKSVQLYIYLLKNSGSIWSYWELLGFWKVRFFNLVYFFNYLFLLNLGLILLFSFYYFFGFYIGLEHLYQYRHNIWLLYNVCPFSINVRNTFCHPPIGTIV